MPNITLTGIPPWITREFASQNACWRRSREMLECGYRFPVEVNNRNLQLELCANDWSTFHLGAECGIRNVHPFLDRRLAAFCLGCHATCEKQRRTRNRCSRPP